jgi:hypothetical protein
MFKQWFDGNKGNHPPQARRSVPEFILHAFRRAGPRSDDGYRNLVRLQLSSDSKNSD